jgi:hypothetical protein
VAQELHPVTPKPAPQPSPGVAASSPLSSAFGPPSHPDHFDFGEVWDGDSSMKTLSFTTQNTGMVRVEIPSAAFFVSQIRELSPPKTGSRTAMSQGEVKGRAVFGQLPGPWTYSILAAGDQLQIDVMFRPKFDFGTMMAGPKTASMKVSGPGTTVPWTFSIPLNGMFNGKHTIPLLTMLDKEQLVPVALNATEGGTAQVRLVGAGEDVSGKIVPVSSTPGLNVSATQTFALGKTESKDVKVWFNGSGGHTDATPLDATVAFEFARQGQTTKQQTMPGTFRVMFIPDQFHRTFPNKSCNGVGLSDLQAVFYASGGVTWYFRTNAVNNEAHFEVFFPQAGRTLLHTSVPKDLAYHPTSLSVRVEETSIPTWGGEVHNDFFFKFDGHYNPGPHDTLDKYRALLHSTAEVRCW